MVANADALAAALAAEGWSWAVEARGGLALLTVPPNQLARLADRGERDAVLAAAKGFGFTHVAVEPADQTTGRAAVLRD